MTTFTEGRFYRLSLSDGESAYMLIGASLKNGAHKAVKIESYYPKAAHYSTTNLTPSRWQEVSETDVPAKLLARILAKAA